MRTIKTPPMKNSFPNMMVCFGFFALTLVTIPSASYADGINGLNAGKNQNTAGLGTQAPSESSNGSQLGQARHPKQDFLPTGEDPVLTELNRLNQGSAQNKNKSPSEPNTETIVEVDADAVDLYLKNKPKMEKRVPEKLLVEQNFAKKGERIFRSPESEVELDQDAPHLFYPPNSDIYVSSDALGPCVAVFATFPDGSMIAGHYSLALEADGTLSSGEDNQYAQMIHAIEERARSVGSPSSVVLAGAWSQVTDQDTGEKLFPDSSEVRSQVVADILAVGTAKTAITPLWNGGLDWMEAIVNPAESDAFVVANGNRGLHLNTVELKK